jgi:FkbM family methyltransferase
MSFMEGIAAYYDILGVRGVLAVSAYRLTGRPREITAKAKGVRHPVHIRVRTTDASIYREILLRGEYALDLPFTPATIVDAGANIGMASIYYAHRYPEARIVAVEAEQSNFDVLRRNVAPYPNILPIHAALWNRDGFVGVSEPDPSTGGFGKWGFVTHEGSGVQARAVTMRTLMTETNIQQIDLLKVDIEGSEKQVFESCDWMNNVRAMVIELHDRFRPGCAAAVNSVTSDYTKSERGEMTFYVRHIP